VGVRRETPPLQSEGKDKKAKKDFGNPWGGNKPGTYQARGEAGVSEKKGEYSKNCLGGVRRRQGGNFQSSRIKAKLHLDDPMQTETQLVAMAGNAHQIGPELKNGKKRDGGGGLTLLACNQSLYEIKQKNSKMGGKCSKKTLMLGVPDRVGQVGKKA